MHDEILTIPAPNPNADRPGTCRYHDVMDGIRDHDPGGSDALPGRWADDAAAIEAAQECYSFLRGVPILFELDDDALWALAHDAQPCSFDPGSRVVAEGDEEVDRRFYVIRTGEADVVRRDRAGMERSVARLGAGSYFGELGLLTNQVRNATVRVAGHRPLEASAFDALAFHGRIAEHVLVFRLLKERRRMARAGGPLGAGRMRLRNLDVLRRLPGPDLEYVLGEARHTRFPERAPILVQGEDGDRFHVLLEGTVEVERDGERVATLGPGDFFGETALLLDTPRTATVRATEHVLTWSITRRAFQRIVGGYLLANPRTQKMVLERMREAIPEDPFTGEAAAD